MSDTHSWYVISLRTRDGLFRVRADICHLGPVIPAETLALAERPKLEHELERRIYAARPGYVIAHPFWAQSSSCIGAGPLTEAEYRAEWGEPSEPSVS